MQLSIVTTLFNSANYLQEFCRRAQAAASELVGENYELILVNDGSPDNSLEMAVQMARTDSKIVVVDLSRNFGHHRAILAGLRYATGKRVFLVDCDLEEEPNWLLRFSRCMDEVECDVVFGVQERRKGGWIERFSGWFFYKMFNTLGGIKLPENALTVRLMTKRYVEALLLHDEREISIGGLFVITGFKQFPITVHKGHRGATSYSLRKRLSVAVNSVTSFSSMPLVAIFYIGFLMSVLAAAGAAYLIFARIIFKTPLIGWTSLIASIWLLGGLMIMFIGVVGIYLAKVFSETKRRPTTIVRDVYRFRNNRPHEPKISQD